MLLNIACFLAVCHPNDILLSSFGAAVADRISALLFPATSSDTKRISVVGERFSLTMLGEPSYQIKTIQFVEEIFLPHILA
jgi:hypothetical protein